MSNPTPYMISYNFDIRRMSEQREYLLQSVLFFSFSFLYLVRFHSVFKKMLFFVECSGFNCVFEPKTTGNNAQPHCTTDRIRAAVLTALQASYSLKCKEGIQSKSKKWKMTTYQ